MTHDVTNQPPPLEPHDLLEDDAALRGAIGRDAPWALDRVGAFAKFVGSPQAAAWGRLANENPPKLRTHDRYGRRVDEIEFHPAWHELLQLSTRNAIHALPWLETRPGAHVARAALLYLATQNEAGHLCPISMTFSSVPAIRTEPVLAAEWEPRILALGNPSLIGMAMTEKQGGSDLRANTTRAVPGDGRYLLTGHKWFCSAPQSAAFLVLAQAPGGLTCFLMPRGPEFRIQRLKDKLGNRSNASGEVEFENAPAHRIGEEGRGVSTIIEMVTHTRLDCTLSSAAILRAAYVQARHHARHRSAFGKLLVDQPLMKTVLDDIALESEAATLLAMRIAKSFEERGPFQRIATAVAKYWICKRTPAYVAEALECHGGNGYVEESPMPRLFRESPVNSLWEGSGNVICLDVLRAMRKEPESFEALLAEIRGVDRRIDALVPTQAPDEAGARRFVGRLAVALQASLLARHSTSLDAFLAR